MNIFRLLNLVQQQLRSASESVQPVLITWVGLKCGPFFQRYIVRDISLTEIYRWLIEILSAILKRTRHGGQSRERL